MDTIKRFLARKGIALFLIAAFVLGTSAVAQDIIPQPQVKTAHEGSFNMNENTKLYTNMTGKEKKLMKKYLRTLPYLFRKGHADDSENVIRLLIAPKNSLMTSDEGYTLNVTPKQITISAPTGAGLFYGIQSMLQISKLTRAATPSSPATLSVPAIDISDNPRFGYRGLMIDFSRHFFPKEFVMKQIDALAYYKINRLHMHLTDAGGWRIQIKKYPRLTKMTGYRTESDWVKWWANGYKFCKKKDKGAYGGFYTQKDIRDIVKYAAIRHITVIPEIEMPGHSEEVLAAYPELACSGKPYTDHDLCIGKEITFRFLENVLKEVIKLFPSEYIHIGGDEATKTAWRSCPLCQKRMQDEHLKSVEELQSYLVCRIERFLNSRGKKLLGWDEILEGKLAPKATVMSWRGESGGMAAAAAGHHAVMTPGTYCYLDHYQDVPMTQPKAIGGFLPLENAYSYNPVPDSIAGKVGKYIDGVQGNMWTEYIATPEHAEYMIYPRILAISEVGWSDYANKSWSDFHRRALKAVDYLRSKDYHPFDLATEVGHRKESLQLVDHEALGKKVTYNAPYSDSFKASGVTSLTDGKLGDWDYSNSDWQGFISHDRLDVTVDMGETTDLHSISAEFMQSAGAEIFSPAEIIISVSDDGTNFVQIDKESFSVSKEKDYFIKPYKWTGNAKGRYIRYQAHSDSKFGGWLFTDEIIVNPK